MEEPNPTRSSKRVITDYVSGRQIALVGPEEPVTQHFSRYLVERYRYDKRQLHTRPQWHVPPSPSAVPHHRSIPKSDDEAGMRKHPGYPVDIVVFDEPKNLGDPEHVYMLIECKSEGTELTEKIAEQPKIYFQLQRAARILVLTNGVDKRVWYKRGKNGDSRLIEIPDLPMQGEAADLGGRKTRKMLRPADDLKRRFEEVRNYIHSNDPSITRDEEIIREVVSLLICKIYDEEFGGGEEDPVEFRWSPEETDEAIYQRINRLYETVRADVADVFDPKNDRRIKLAPASVAYFVKKVHPFRLSISGKDAVGEAFETFIGDALKGKEGQYFTPRNVVDMMVRFVDPKPTDRIIDPACGTGGFLVHAMRYVFEKIQRQEGGSARPGRVETRQKEWARTHLFGVDKDSLCTRFSKAYLAILGDGHTGLFCKDSLEFKDWSEEMKRRIQFGSFDVVLTNPPFGEGLTREPPVINDYDLGHEWKRVKSSDAWEPSGGVREKQENSILFLELCLKLLRPGGKLGIVFPETHCASPGDGYLWSWLLPQFKVLGVVDIPDTTFQPYTHAKAQVLFIEKSPPPREGHDIIMATARKVGKNSRGDPIYRLDERHRKVIVDGKPLVDDDLPKVTRQIVGLRDTKQVEPDSFGFTLRTSALEHNTIIPRYYDKRAIGAIRTWAKENACLLVRPRDLVAEGILKVQRGHAGVGKQDQRDEGVPYIRTSNIGVLEVELFAENVIRTSETLYETLSRKLKLQAHDLLFVKRGEKRIGNVAIVYPGMEKFLVVAEVDVIRVMNPENKYGLTPFGLLYLLTHEQVKRQFDNKKFYETIIWNIADRWQDVLLPIPRDPTVWTRIQEEIREAVQMRADGLRRVLALTHEGEEESPVAAPFEAESSVTPGSSAQLHARR